MRREMPAGIFVIQKAREVGLQGFGPINIMQVLLVHENQDASSA